MCTGMRGLVAFSVALTTATSDLHSGSFGGAVRNAAHVAAELATALHDADGRVTLPGYYDAARPVTDDVRDAIGALPFSDAEFGEHSGGATRTGEAGFSTLERIWVRPTAEVTGIQAGYAGDGVKTIVPARATLKVTFRLVPDQDPETIATSFRAWLDATVPEGVVVE